MISPDQDGMAVADCRHLRDQVYGACRGQNVIIPKLMPPI